MSTAKTEHPTGRIWDAITEIAVDGTIQGKLSVDPRKGTVGRLRFTTDDGQRFAVDVEPMGGDDPR